MMTSEVGYAIRYGRRWKEDNLRAWHSTINIDDHSAMEKIVFGSDAEGKLELAFFVFSNASNTLFIFYRQSLLSRKKKNEGVKKRSLTSNLQHTTNLACVMIFFLSLLIYHYLLLNILHHPHLIHHPHLFYHFFLLSKLSKAKQHWLNWYSFFGFLLRKEESKNKYQQKWSTIRLVYIKLLSSLFLFNTFILFYAFLFIFCSFLSLTRLHLAYLT